MWWTCPPRIRDDENWNAYERKKDQEDEVAQYDLCSGSLITNKGSHKMEETQQFPLFSYLRRQVTTGPT